MDTQFDRLDISELMGESERLAQENGFENNFVKMPAGAGFVTVRLLPPAQGKRFYCATRIHRVNQKSCHCPRVLTRTPTGDRWLDSKETYQCDICRYYSNLWKKADNAKTDAEKEALIAAARALKPMERYYYNCIVRSVTDPKTQVTEKNVGPKILSVGKQLHQKIITAICGDNKFGEAPLGNVTLPTTGRDFKIKNTPKGDFANYESSCFMESSPLGNPDEVDRWLANLHDLAALRQLKKAEEMKALFKQHLGQAPDADAEFMAEYGGASVDLEKLAEQHRQQKDGPGVEVKATGLIGSAENLEAQVARTQAAQAREVPVQVQQPAKSESVPMGDEEFLGELAKINQPD